MSTEERKSGEYLKTVKCHVVGRGVASIVLRLIASDNAIVIESAPDAYIIQGDVIYCMTLSSSLINNTLAEAAEISGRASKRTSVAFKIRMKCVPAARGALSTKL